MLIRVAKNFSFEACHKLPSYQGDCANLHGHSYKMEVEILGPINVKTGMVVDFKLLSKLVEDTIIKTHDHKYLNDIYPNPTAELMVLALVDMLEPIVRAHFKDCRLVRLTLWETEKCRATWEDI